MNQVFSLAWRFALAAVVVVALAPLRAHGLLRPSMDMTTIASCEDVTDSVTLTNTAVMLTGEIICDERKVRIPNYLLVVGYPEGAGLTLATF